MQYFTNIYFSLIPLPLVTSYLPLQMEREILENSIIFFTNSVPLIPTNTSKWIY